MFLNGTKLWEIRAISPRFNKNTVYKGRYVEIRNGYQRKGAEFGKITNVILINDIYNISEEIIAECLPIAINDPLWEEIDKYNEKYKGNFDDEGFIVFKIRLERIA
jgi:hypothetical protein